MLQGLTVDSLAFHDIIHALKQVHTEAESNRACSNNDRSLESFHTVVLLVTSLSCIILHGKTMHHPASYCIEKL